MIYCIKIENPVEHGSNKHQESIIKITEYLSKVYPLIRYNRKRWILPGGNKSNAYIDLLYPDVEFLEEEINFMKLKFGFIEFLEPNIYDNDAAWPANISVEISPPDK